MRILLTRADEDARRSAEALRRAGHEPVILPLFERQACSSPVPAGVFDATIFTSAAAPSFFARHEGFSALGKPILAKPSFCVGERTRQAARELGFVDCHCAGGDAAALADLISVHHANGRFSGDAPILYPTALDRAFDFAAALPMMRIAEFPVYESRILEPGEEALRAAIDMASGGAAFVYSARSARHLFELTLRHGLIDEFSSLTMVAISEKTASGIPAATDNIRVLVAKSPNEAAMIEILGD